VIGWHYNWNTTVALLAPTIINLVSFMLLLLAMVTGDKVVYARDPTDMNLFLFLPAARDTGMVGVNLHTMDIYSTPANRVSGEVDDEKVL
jgi:hypothetical protein